MTTQLKDGSTVEDPRLDRLVEFDEKSKEYPIRALFKPARHATHPRPRSYTWSVDRWLDQGQEGRCVEYSICHELVARPAPVSDEKVAKILAERGIYWPAQQEDQWPGGSYPGALPYYEGTSVLAGMKVALRLGFFAEYRWAFGVEDVVVSLGYHGPAVLGINWYTGMRNTDIEGFITPSGYVEGGHAILAHAVKIKWKMAALLKFWLTRTFEDVDLDKSYATLWNSWGPRWGVQGKAKITLRDLDKLLKEQGEACIPVRRLLG